MIKKVRSMITIIAGMFVISSISANIMAANNTIPNTSKYPDVTTDAFYFETVNVLASLNIISGFDDGTFRPDELLTRAQVTKMIVDALDEGEMAKKSKATSQFYDVQDSHWAKGYINQGAADQIIAGYSSTEFGPDDNVTYAQAQKMLVSAIGYETYAQGSGGWPNGYKSWAKDLGITGGITGLWDDTKITRAQAAVMIYNAMNAPICVIKDYDMTYDGRKVPNLEIKDGEGCDFQSLFTKKHDVYKVEGYLKNNNTFVITYAENFDDEYYPKGSSKEVNIPTNIGWSSTGSQVVNNKYYGSEYLNIPCTAFLSKGKMTGWSIMYMTGNENSEYVPNTPAATPKPTATPKPSATEKPKATTKPVAANIVALNGAGNYMSNIASYDGVSYYYVAKYDTTQYGLFKENGSSIIKLCDINKGTSVPYFKTIFPYGDYIYFVANSTLYRVNKNGNSDRETIAAYIVHAYADEQMLYYSKSNENSSVLRANGLYSIKLSDIYSASSFDSNSSKIANADIFSGYNNNALGSDDGGLFIKDGWLYGSEVIKMTDNDIISGVGKKNIYTGEEVIISEDNMVDDSSYLNFIDNYIFLKSGNSFGGNVGHSTIIKMREEDGKKGLFGGIVNLGTYAPNGAAGSNRIGFVNAYNGYIYYLYNGNTTQLRRMDYNGKDDGKVADIEIRNNNFNFTAMSLCGEYAYIYTSRTNNSDFLKVNLETGEVTNLSH